MNDAVAAEDYRAKAQKLKIWYHTRANWNRRFHLTIQTVLILSAAVVPILAALEWTTYTIVVSAIVAALTGISKLARFDELWLRYRSAAEALRRECRLFDSRLLDYATETQRMDLFAERVEAIVSNEHAQWTAHRRGDDARHDQVAEKD